MPRVNPEILRWARETAGLTPEAAAGKIGLKPAKGLTATERLAALEAGETIPTRPLLVRMAKQYRRPLLIFYLPAPPPRGNRGQDFRTLPTDYTTSDEALLDALIRDVQARQSIVRAVMEAEDEAVPLPFIGAMRMSDGVAALTALIRDVLQVESSEFRAQSNPERAFAVLRAAAERAGVFVLLRGDLGTYHTSLGLQEFRGFALADSVAPFIVINSQEAKAARSFTLVHELAHLCLGQTGISGELAGNDIEKFCNAVAGEFLVPMEEVRALRVPEAAGVSALRDTIADLATRYNVSATMLAYRLLLAKRIDRLTWDTLHTWYREQWLQARETEKHRNREREKGPDPNVVLKQRLGEGLLGLVHRMMQAGALTTSKAGIVLGVRPKRVEKLLPYDRTPHVA